MAPTILLVEDEAFVREVECEVLRSQGFSVMPAENASEAMKLFQQNSSGVDLLVSDLVMPGESGHQLASRVRALRPEMAVLLTSGYDDQRIPGIAYLPKPFSTRSLIAKVREMLASRPRSAAAVSSTVSPAVSNAVLSAVS